MTIFDVEVDEYVNAIEALRSNDYIPVSDSMLLLDVQSQLTRAFPMVLTDTTNITPATSYAFYITRLIVDPVSIADTMSPTFIYLNTLLEGLDITELMVAGIPTTLSDTVNITETLSFLNAVQIAETIGIGRALVANAKKGVTIAEIMELADSLARFMDGTISEALAVVETVVRRAIFTLSLTDSPVITDLPTRSLVIRLTVPEMIDITFEQAIQGLYNPTIAEAFEIVAAYFSPDDGFTTWAINTGTGAVTEYLDYKFNSFAFMGNKYYAAGEAGLYVLQGDDNDGDDIISAIKGGWLQFGGSRYTSFKGAYIGMRGAGEVYLRLTTGDGLSTTYKVMAKSMQTTKVNMGKGHRARYFTFELITTGQDFDLDTLEFLPITAQRRI